MYLQGWGGEGRGAAGVCGNGTGLCAPHPLSQPLPLSAAPLLTTGAKLSPQGSPLPEASVRKPELLSSVPLTMYLQARRS